jgi:hypothetical protein
MEKKIFFIVSQKLSASLPNWQKKYDEKVNKFCSKKNNYLPKNTLYEVQEFLHRGC